MAINLQTPGINHIALRCKDMEITKNFYRATLGLPLVYESENLNGFMAGNVLIGFLQANPNSHDEVFNPMSIGMDHIAISCETIGELERVANGLKEAGVENTGIKFDDTLQKKYVAFKDPDRIQWEFYMMK